MNTQYHGEQIAYHRTDSGLLEQTTVLVTSDGEYHDQHGYPLERTEHTDDLSGWPTEGLHRVYRNDGGCELLIQERAWCGGCDFDGCGQSGPTEDGTDNTAWTCPDHPGAPVHYYEAVQEATSADCPYEVGDIIEPY